LIEVNKFSSGSGFGFKRNKSGELKRNDHPFSVVFGDNVEVGRLTNIDMGLMAFHLNRDWHKDRLTGPHRA